MAGAKKIAKPEDRTLTIRRAETRDVIILSAIYSVLICIILNAILYVLNKDEFGKNILSTALFNILSTNVVVFITTVMCSYCLYIESVIQSRRRRYYYKQDDQTYSPIFNILISLLFALITSFFLFFSISNYMSLGRNFSVSILGVITIILIVFTPLTAIIYSFYFKLVKILLYYSLLLKEKFLSTIKEDIDSEIYISKINHWDLWIISLKILNIDEIQKKLNISKNKIINKIIYNFKHNVKSTDYIISLNYSKGLVGYIIKNIDPTIVDNFIKTKIIPFLEKDMVVNNIQLDLKIDYTKDNISKNPEIDSISDVIASLR